MAQAFQAHATNRTSVLPPHQPQQQPPSQEAVLREVAALYFAFTTWSRDVIPYASRCRCERSVRGDIVGKAYTGDVGWPYRNQGHFLSGSLTLQEYVMAKRSAKIALPAAAPPLPVPQTPPMIAEVCFGGPRLKC